ncbi:hypothetical protein GLV94_00675 [Virgibacillus halodenitrificans]|uniref:hypothetical protein n=1 Tax=Virgibacillus halodenitrificans TaxID=1482 RepID=UPI001369CEF5|nr:hypothetical protein [Virgibacillus halodenitrificans]MYL44147.1 hypothetical protein [Virgibacillus halodenitrificans]
MLVTSSFSELMHAKKDLETFKQTQPETYESFVGIVHLTRQLQFNYQYMGCLLMDEEPTQFRPQVQDDFVLQVFHKEVMKLKQDQAAKKLCNLLGTYRQIGYANLCKLIMGKSPNVLVGPQIV